MQSENLDIYIGAPQQPHLILRPLEKPTSIANQDKCCWVEVIVSAGNFKGSSRVIIEVDSFQQLREALTNFSKNPIGEFTFSSVAREFWASIREDKTGKFEAYCLLDDNENKYTRLRFKVEFRKDELIQSLASLEKFLSSLGIITSKL